jgi:hypothetical protein
MARKTTLNVKSLEALGPERLARLLMDISKGKPALKRQLRMALAASKGGKTLIASVRKRLGELGRSKSFIDWNKAKAFTAEIDELRRMIFEEVGRDHPAEAIDLLWDFLGIAASCYERCDDSNGYMSDVFHEASGNMGLLAVAAQLDAQLLSQRLFSAYLDNGYGQYDYLISILAPSLGKDGLLHLRALFADWQASLKTNKNKQRDSKSYYAQIAIQEIADALGDVQAFRDQYSPELQKRPDIAADIAVRYLTGKQPQAAMQVLDDVDEVPDLAQEVASGRRCDLSWHEARIAALDALDKGDEAQALRWDVFLATLNADILKAHLDRMTGFEDIAAEEVALEHAVSYPHIYRALHFLISWRDKEVGYKPSKALALDRAATLIKSRYEEIDGRHYELLAPAASVLEARHSLASCLLHRSQIDFALNNARSTRYKHAARHLRACDSLNDSIDDYGHYTPHTEYLANLKDQHGRKTSFWDHYSIA